MSTSKRVWIWSLSLAGVLLAIFWIFNKVIEAHHKRILALFWRLEIGKSRGEVSEIAQTFTKASRIRCIESGSWQKYMVWAGDDWILVVNYTNGLTEFVGIVSSDNLRRRATGAPAWKCGILQSPKLD